MSESRDEKKKRRREEKRQRQWAEVEEYRALLEAPEPNRFDEGFTIRTVIGVLFISLIMTRARCSSGCTQVAALARQRNG